MELLQGLLALDLPRKRVSCTRDSIRLTGYMILSINQSHLSTSERNLDLEARRSGISSRLGPVKVESKVARDDDKHSVFLFIHLFSFDLKEESGFLSPASRLILRKSLSRSSRSEGGILLPFSNRFRINVVLSETWVRSCESCIRSCDTTAIPMISLRRPKCH